MREDDLVRLIARHAGAVSSNKPRARSSSSTRPRSVLEPSTVEERHCCARHARSVIRGPSLWRGENGSAVRETRLKQ